MASNVLARGSSGLKTVIAEGVGIVREHTIEIGSRVLWVDNIGSLVIVRGQADYSLAIFGAFLVLVGLFMLQSQATMALLLMAIGIALIVVSINQKTNNGLSVGTTDGRNTLIVSTDEQFLARVLDLLREKIETESITLQGTFDIGATHVNSSGGGMALGKGSVASGAGGDVRVQTAPAPKPVSQPSPAHAERQPPPRVEDPTSLVTFETAPPRSYDSSADLYAPSEERKGLPVAAIAVIAMMLLGALGFGLFAFLKNNEAQRQAAAAQQAAQSAEQAAETQRQQLTARMNTCGAHTESTTLTVVMQDCGDLVWSGDQNARATATARLQAAANHHDPAADEALAQVPAVFIDHDGCPFEGCMYGVWSARAVNTLYDAPDGNPTGSIEAGDTVIAWRGDVYTTPIRGTVRAAYGAYQPGEEVYLLTYEGEGLYRIWHNGVISATPEQVGGDCSKGACTFDFGAAEQQRHWWVQVRRQDGRTGWLLDPHDFNGMGAFD